MAYVQIPKDLSNVKTKVAFNLTKRQLIGFAVAGLIGIPTYLKTRIALGNDLAVFLMLIITIPIFFVVFYEKDGLPCEKYLKYVYLHEKHQPKVRVSKDKFIEMRKEEQDINGKKSGSAKKSRKKKKTGRKTTKKGKRVKKGS
ncbi:PrgI family protein [Clostridium sporogenes]|uniref:PrgI family protein n=1 Tax=Clostridium sporogenes TaxID=1509 RepID=UPI0015EEB46C|nr:PrgI family protein [Clostridium sporogenes]MBA4507547.1 PrgI family protein [Clostridium sporogenes]